jgi:hypothetical protein
MEYSFNDIRESNMKNKHFILVDEHNEIMNIKEIQINFYKDKMNHYARLYVLSIIINIFIFFRNMY